MTRFVSRYRQRNKIGSLAAFMHRAQWDTLVWSASGTAALVAAGLLWPGIEASTRIALILSVLTIPPMALQRVYASIANAYRQFMASYVPGFFFRPTIFAGGLAIFLVAGARPSVWEVCALSLAAFVAALLVQRAGLTKRLREISSHSTKADRRLQRRWAKEAWPLVIVASFVGLLSDLAVFVVTPFMSLADVAAFGICLKIAFLVGFTVQVSHQVILPDLGEAVARRESGSMRAKILGASLFPIVLTVGGVIGSMAFGGDLLAIFNEEFRGSQDTLTIIMVAQLVRALAGPSSVLLSMKGAQIPNAWICALSFVVMVVSSAILASLWGAEGAAWAVVITTIFWLVATAIVLYRIDGARTDLAGLMFMSRGLATTTTED